MFNSDQIKSFVRSVVIGLGAFFVGKGWIGAEMVAEIAGGVAAFVAAAWGIWFHGGATKVELAEVIVGTEMPAQVEGKVVVQAEKLAGI